MRASARSSGTTAPPTTGCRPDDVGGRPTRSESMSILVIGGTGFIGPRLIRRLIERGQSVVCMDVNLTPASPYASMPSQATVIRGDVTRFEDVMRAVLEVKPERMINLAYGLGAGEGNPHQVMLLDVLGMDNCFEDRKSTRLNSSHSQISY